MFCFCAVSNWLGQRCQEMRALGAKDADLDMCADHIRVNEFELVDEMLENIKAFACFIARRGWL